MRQLLYVSSTHRDVPDTVLDAILAASRKNNASVGVTGVLLYLAGGFIQVLEGDDDNVAKTYARICNDKRHWNASVILDRQTPRAFGEWSMGFERPSPTAQTDGMFTISREIISGSMKPGAALEIMTFLRNFYRVQTGDSLA